MSDTSIEDELPMAEGASGFTIPLSPDIQSVIATQGTVGADGQPVASRVDRATARSIVMQRVLGLLDPQDGGTRWWETALDAGGVALAVASRGKVAPQAKGGTIYNEEALWYAAALADLTVGSFKDEELVDAALAGLDLRPFMALAAANPEAFVAQAQVDDALQANMGLDDYTLNAGAIFAGDTIDVAAVSDQAISAFNAEQIGVITEQRAATNQAPLTAAELAAINEFGPDMVGTTPVAKILANEPMIVTNADGTQEVQQLSIEDILAGAGDDVLEGPPIIDRATIEQWARTGITDLDTIAGQEAEAYSTGALAPGEAVYGFDVGQYRGGGPRRGPVRAGGTMSAIDALDFLRTLDEREFTAMQDKLARAGYFERLGARPERGYQDDEATKNAWRLALQDSLQRGVALPEMVDQMANEQATRRQQRMQQFSIKDTRFAANQMAMEVLGRNLTGDEYNTVRSFLQGLQRDRRDDVLGIDPMTWQREGMDPTVGFDAQDIQQGVERAIGGEADAQASYDTLRRLNDFLGLGGPTEGLDS